MGDRAVWTASVVLGALAYAALIAWEPDPTAPRFFGIQIYDYYFLALTEGRLDIPVRIANIEGHYNAEGQAFVYHGFGPLIYRAVLSHFVDLLQTPVHLISIWVSAVVGTAMYHLALIRAIASQSSGGKVGLGLSLILAMVLWVTAPGTLLVTNASLFQEPVAFGYAAAGWFVMIMTTMIHGGRSTASSLIPLSFTAALVLFSRPHLAVGLYVGCGLIGILVLLRGLRQNLGRAIVTILILGCAGLAVLAVNEMRSGNPFQAHGGFGDVVFTHGVIYWPDVKGESPYHVTFREHGRFHHNRILPNLVMYAGYAAPYAEGLTEVWRGWTASSGVGRLEDPMIGFAFLWLPWVLLILMAGARPAPGTQHVWLLLIATGIGALFMLSYPTITLRYRVDLWPFVFGLAILAAARLNHTSVLGRPTTTLALCLATVVTVVALIPTLMLNKDVLREDGRFSEWSSATCVEQATKKGFSADRVEELCRYPIGPEQGQ